MAFNWAQRLANSHEFEHSENTYKSQELGENLFMLIGSHNIDKVDGTYFNNN